MSGECGFVRACEGIPEMDGGVPAPTGEGFSIGTERNTIDPVRVSRECHFICFINNVP